MSFIQTEVSRAEKIKRGKKVSRIHLNLDGIIMVDDGGRRENYLDTARRDGGREWKRARGRNIFS